MRHTLLTPWRKLLIRYLYFIFFGLMGFVVASAILQAFAHENHWYDMECCNNQDCAPVTQTIKAPDGVGDLMTTKYGTFLVTPDMKYKRKASQDNRFHLCVRLDSQGKIVGDKPEILCLYSPALY